jgi:hypothetical protein
VESARIRQQRHPRHPHPFDRHGGVASTQPEVSAQDRRAIEHKTAGAEMTLREMAINLDEALD